MGNKIFRYANNSETKAIVESFAEIKKLKIDYSHKKERHFKSFNKFIIHNDFEQWLIRFSNKLVDIEFSYVQLVFSFNNGIPDENWKRNKEEGGIVFFENFKESSHRTAKYLFDYFVEGFYYHYFSSIDLLYKVLNKFFCLEVDENSFHFNKDVLKGIKKIDISLHDEIKKFISSTKDNRRIRNNFTHNYAPNEVDLRSKEIIKDGKKSIIMMDPTYTTSKELLIEIQDLIKLYLPLIKQIQKRINLNDFILEQQTKR